MRRRESLALALLAALAMVSPGSSEPQRPKPKPGTQRAAPKPAPKPASKPAPNAVRPPLPPPRPAELPAQGPPPNQPPSPAPAPPVAPAVDTSALAACLEDLEARGVEVAPTRLPEQAPEASPDCAVPDPVTIARVRLPDGAAVDFESAVTVRCTFALELAGWIRDDLAPIATRQGAALTRMVGVSGHACRTRNGQPGAPVSEHATGNAFDLRALELGDGRMVELSHADAGTKTLREEVRASACARFRTVLGPGSDASHADHLHLDMRQRRGDFRMCQWTVE